MKVKVVHWWPGRKFKGRSPIPEYLIEEAKRRGSRYLTVAFTISDGMELIGTAFCNPKDTPSREMGRRIAVGRLLAEMRI